MKQAEHTPENKKGHKTSKTCNNSDSPEAGGFPSLFSDSDRKLFREIWASPLPAVEKREMVLKLSGILFGKKEAVVCGLI